MHSHSENIQKSIVLSFAIDPNLTDENGNNALHLALQEENVQLKKVLQLIPHIHNIDVENKNGLSALRIVMERLTDFSNTSLTRIRISIYKEIIFELLKKGANPNTTTKEKNTLLHIAAFYPSRFIISDFQTFINSGVNLELTNARNKTVFDIFYKTHVFSVGFPILIELVKNSKNVSEKATKLLLELFKDSFEYNFKMPLSPTFMSEAQQILTFEPNLSKAEVVNYFVSPNLNYDLIFLLLIYGLPLETIFHRNASLAILEKLISDEHFFKPENYGKSISQVNAFLSLGVTIPYDSSTIMGALRDIFASQSSTDIVLKLFSHAQKVGFTFKVLDCILTCIKHNWSATRTYEGTNILDFIYDKYPEVKNYVRKYLPDHSEINNTKKVFSCVDINDLRFELKLYQPQTLRNNFLCFLYILSKFLNANEQIKQQASFPFHLLSLELIFEIISFFDFEKMERDQTAGFALTRFILENPPFRQQEKLSGLSIKQKLNQNHKYEFSFFARTPFSFITKSERARRAYIQKEDELRSNQNHKHPFFDNLVGKKLTESSKQQLDETKVDAKKLLTEDLKTFSSEPIKGGIEKFEFLDRVSGKLFDDNIIAEAKEEVIKEIKIENQKLFNSI